MRYPRSLQAVRTDPGRPSPGVFDVPRRPPGQVIQWPKTPKPKGPRRVPKLPTPSFRDRVRRERIKRGRALPIGNLWPDGPWSPKPDYAAIGKRELRKYFQPMRIADVMHMVGGLLWGQPAQVAAQAAAFKGIPTTGRGYALWSLDMDGYTFPGGYRSVGWTVVSSYVPNSTWGLEPYNYEAGMQYGYNPTAVGDFAYNFFSNVGHMFVEVAAPDGVNDPDQNRGWFMRSYRRLPSGSFGGFSGIEFTAPKPAKDILPTFRLSPGYELYPEYLPISPAWIAQPTAGPLIKNAPDITPGRQVGYGEPMPPFKGRPLEPGPVKKPEGPVRERKQRWGRAMGIIWGAIGNITEGVDLVEAFYEGLPKALKRQIYAELGRQPNPAEMAMYVWKHIDRIDTAAVLENYTNDLVEDWLYSVGSEYMKKHNQKYDRPIGIEAGGGISGAGSPSFDLSDVADWIEDGFPLAR